MQMAISVPSISVLLLFPNYWGISGVWAGLTTVMTLRMVAGFWRYIISIIESLECVNTVLRLGIILYVPKTFSTSHVLLALDLSLELLEGR